MFEGLVPRSAVKDSSKFKEVRREAHLSPANSGAISSSPPTAGIATAANTQQPASNGAGAAEAGAGGGVNIMQKLFAK